MAMDLFVTISSDEPITSEDLEEASLQLRRELRAIDGVSVYPIVSGDAPPGARSDVVTVVGAFGVTVWTTGLSIKVIHDIVSSWVDRNNGKSASIHGTDGTAVSVVGHSEKGTQKLFKIALTDSDHATTVGNLDETQGL